jgi:hypothetical protein
MLQMLQPAEMKGLMVPPVTTKLHLRSIAVVL